MNVFIISVIASFDSSQIVEEQTKVSHHLILPSVVKATCDVLPPEVKLLVICCEGEKLSHRDKSPAVVDV